MINGIDIYHGDVISQQDFSNMAKNNDLYFSYIKASTGGSGKDNMFTKYWDMARQAGLICGAYHFFWPVTDTGTQADNFMAQYKQVSRAGVLPPAIDIEWTKTNAAQTEFWNNVPGAKRILILKDFLQKLELLLNVKPVIYTAFSFWQQFITPFASLEDNTFFGQYRLWIADPNANGKIPSPWQGTQAFLIQNHFGDNVPATAPIFQRLDNDIFSGDLKTFLNNTMPGFALMKGFPFSNVVKDLQTALKAKGLLADTPDGFFGDHTATAVTAFQTANNLTGNGIVDAQTWNKLLV